LVGRQERVSKLGKLQDSLVTDFWCDCIEFFGKAGPSEREVENFESRDVRFDFVGNGASIS
jgi:hypothetical protein